MWIEYSARDAVATWWVWDKLRSKLKQMEWQVGVGVGVGVEELHKRPLISVFLS
jgi:hypothetical protein